MSSDSTSAKEFWANRYFDFADSLNTEIWAKSPEVQREIQSPESLRHPGAVGAQQCMLADGRTVLPWVPDLVGTNWRDESGLMIFGAAYAGFIEEYSPRRATMPLAMYLAASSVEEFQKAFLDRVVRQDANYYGPLFRLAAHLGPASHLSLVDMCRASLVKRGAGERARVDSSSGADVSSAISAYIEHPQSSDWLWRRLVGGSAKCVVALGSTTEHGLLRLLARYGMQITDGEIEWTSHTPQSTWPTRYADSRRQLNYWLGGRKWWTVQGQVEGVEREWFVLPIYHPARHATPDPGYVITGKLLQEMRELI